MPPTSPDDRAGDGSHVAPRYGVVVPVKPPAFAKSRLGDLGDEARRDLAVAFAVDTVTAVAACPLVARVMVVTDDHLLAGGLADLGVDVLPDGTSDDLNGTLRLGAAELHRRDPSLRLAGLCADLPALRSDELGTVLKAGSGEGMSFLADADGIGTTAVLAPTPDTFRPLFGEQSRRRHLEAGAHEVDGTDVPTVRRDVDDRDDLTAALALGVGPRTSLVVTLLGLG